MLAIGEPPQNLCLRKKGLPPKSRFHGHADRSARFGDLQTGVDFIERHPFADDPVEGETIPGHLQEIQRLSAVLATDRAPDVPPGFAAAVMRRARTIAEPQRVETISFLPAWWHAMTHPARIAAAAMFAVSMGLGALMGWDASRTRTSSLGAVKPDLVAQYSLDYFEEAPAGSLAQVYLALAE